MPLHADGQPCDAENPYEDAACNTLKLTFSKPAPYFHTVMSLWVTYPAKEENITDRRRELVEQLQVPDRQRPLRPAEPGTVRQGLLHAERELLG